MQDARPAAVTVVVLSHRKERLPDAIRSVLTQTFGDIQLLVQYGQRAWPQKLNEIVALARGEFVVILADDDRLAPTFVEDTVRFARLSGADVVYTDLRIWRDGERPEWGSVLRINSALAADDGYTGDLVPAKFWAGSNLPATFLCRRDTWEQLGGQDVTLSCADTEWWYRAAVAGVKAGYLARPLFWYRSHDDSVPAKMAAAAFRAFHRKHFAAFGIRCYIDPADPDKIIMDDPLPEPERKALLESGWLPDW